MSQSTSVVPGTQCGALLQATTSRQIDNNLLAFWQASKLGDPSRRFLYSYQIIEYCSFGYIEECVRSAVKKALSSPTAFDNIDSTTTKILECLAPSQMHHAQKIDALLRHAVNPDLIFREIKLNIDFFTKKIQFEGGYVLEPIVKDTWKEDDFRVNGILALSKALRETRNALSHGREQRASSVIAPTTANLRLLQGWVPLVSVAAAEVILYRL